MVTKIPAGKYKITLDQLIVIYLKQIAIVSIPLLFASLGLFYAILRLGNMWYELIACFLTVMMFIIAKLYIDEKVEQELRKYIVENYVGDIDGK